jgi:hypothetical protein
VASLRIAASLIADTGPARGSVGDLHHRVRSGTPANLSKLSALCNLSILSDLSSLSKLCVCYLISALCSLLFVVCCLLIADMGPARGSVGDLKHSVRSSTAVCCVLSDLCSLLSAVCCLLISDTGSAPCVRNCTPRDTPRDTPRSVRILLHDLLDGIY